MERLIPGEMLNGHNAFPESGNSRGRQAFLNNFIGLKVANNGRVVVANLLANSRVVCRLYFFPKWLQWLSSSPDGLPKREAFSRPQVPFSSSTKLLLSIYFSHNVITIYQATISGSFGSVLFSTNCTVQKVLNMYFFFTWNTHLWRVLWNWSCSYNTTPPKPTEIEREKCFRTVYKSWTTIDVQ